MKKIINYMIIEENNLHELNCRVNVKIGEGYQPFKEIIQIRTDREVYKYIQVMVKYEK